MEKLTRLTFVDIVDLKLLSGNIRLRVSSGYAFIDYIQLRQRWGVGARGVGGAPSRLPSFVCIRVIKRKKEAQGLSSPDRLFPESESGLQSSKWDRPGY